MSKQQLDNLILVFLPLRGLLFGANAKIMFSLAFIIPIKEKMQFLSARITHVGTLNTKSYGPKNPALQHLKS